MNKYGRNIRITRKQGNGAKIVLKSKKDLPPFPFYGDRLLELSNDIENKRGWSSEVRQGKLVVNEKMTEEHVTALEKILPDLKNPPPIIVDLRRSAAGETFLGIAEKKGYTIVILDSPEDPLPDSVFQADEKPMLIAINHEPSPNSSFQNTGFLN